MLFHHLAIYTKDLEKVKNFYLKYFKCTVNNRYHNPVKEFTSYFISFSDGFRIELMHNPNVVERLNTDKIGLAHFAIGVGTNEKVDALTEKFRVDGYEVKGEPRFTGDAYYESIILDPEGNSVELTAVYNTEICKAEEPDLNKILYLQKCCYLSEAEIINNYNIPPLQQTYSEIKQEFSSQSFLKLVQNGEIIGSVRAYEKDNVCYIGKLIVNPLFQGMGYGKSLLQAIEQKFSHAKGFELFTGVSSINNIALYQKLGYKKYKEKNMKDLKLVYLKKMKF